MAQQSPADDERCRQFVANLEKMLDGFEMKKADLARASNYAASVISEIVSLKRWPTVQHGQAFDRAFGLVNVFEAKSREIRSKAYVEEFKDFPAREATAHDICNYEHSVFPGLIQTERYMRAVFETVPGVQAEDIEQRMAGRLARQEILYRKSPQPPRFWGLMDEAALRRPVADPAVMYEQCIFALEVSRLPHVSLAVVPYAARWHVGLLGACQIVEQEGIPYAVNLDDLADGRVSEDPVIVRRVALRFRVLQHEALSGGDSRDMIARVAEELWKGPSRTGVRALTAVETVETV